MMEPRRHEDDQEEEEAFLGRPSDEAPATRVDTTSASQGGKRRRVVGYLRIVLEIAMAATIAYLLIAKPFVVSRETIRRTPVPRCTFSTISCLECC